MRVKGMNMYRLEEIRKEEATATGAALAAFDAVFANADDGADEWDTVREACLQAREAQREYGWKGRADMERECREVSDKYGLRTDEDHAAALLRECGR
jgi:hypothetical protein